MRLEMTKIMMKGVSVQSVSEKVVQFVGQWVSEWVSQDESISESVNEAVKQEVNQWVRAIDRSDEGLTLETSAFLPFTVANLRFQPSCSH